MQGTVKWFSQQKGYGFIATEEGKDYHFHVRGVNGSELPNAGDTVEFTPKQGKKGLRAVNVEIIKRKQRNTRPKNKDDRINCPHCNKKIVPRLVTYRGEPEKTLCPYCGGVVKSFSDCFIATAVYNDPSCFEVRALRNFRDNTLLNYDVGKMFVTLYYKLSPAIAEWLKGKPMLSKTIRRCLDQLIKILPC
mgnify:CR=1 FL=1|tara:strand:+ start:1077 stop:1649 length:573 start_codon:yes stop_codon:yes gene_type:complete